MIDLTKETDLEDLIAIFRALIIGEDMKETDYKIIEDTIGEMTEMIMLDKEMVIPINEEVVNSRIRREMAKEVSMINQEEITQHKDRIILDRMGIEEIMEMTQTEETLNRKRANGRIMDTADKVDKMRQENILNSTKAVI